VSAKDPYIGATLSKVSLRFVLLRKHLVRAREVNKQLKVRIQNASSRVVSSFHSQFVRSFDLSNVHSTPENIRGIGTSEKSGERR
jgi:hypothetical protein